MPIVSSRIVEDAAQADGRRRIVERHVDHAGGAHERRYKIAAGETPALAAHAAWLELQLPAREIAANVASIVAGRPALAFVHSTPAAARAALRETYRTASATEAANIAAFLLTLTDAQLQASTGLADVTQFKARCSAAVSARDALAAVAGE